MTVRGLDAAHEQQTIALIDSLQVALFGINSRPLHAILVKDALRGMVDCRIAVESDQVSGVVLAAPAGYWRVAPLKHPAVALECLRARIVRFFERGAAGRGAPAAPARPRRIESASFSQRGGAPARTWQQPGDAWRIIFVGTSRAARGRGIATALYRSVMADKSLVARIAPDNAPSIALHRSLGWQLYPDGSVLLALHVHERAVRDAAPIRAGQ